MSAIALVYALSGGRPVGGPSVNSRVAAYEAHLAMEQRSPYRLLSWTFLGPTNISGRANSVAVADRRGKRRIYVGYSGSGLWKTDDDGASWQAVFTRAAATAILCVAVARSNSDTVWILTGTTRSHIPLASVGVYKSTDAAQTWHYMGLEEIGTGGYGRIVIHPKNPNVVYVASAGGPDVPGKSRGLFKTMDGGKHWTRVFYQNADLGPGDLVMDSGNPDTLYVATRTRARGNEAPLSQIPNARTGGSIFKTSDAGITWTEIAGGLPPPNSRGTIAIAQGGSHPSVLYALVNNVDPVGMRALRPDEAPTSGPPPSRIKGPELYQSDDAGSTWHLVSRSDDAALIGSDPQYNPTWAIRGSPTDENIVFALSPGLALSRDGGRHFESIAGYHNDYNDVWIDPADPGVSYVCDDGGFEILENFGGGWTHFTTPTAQIYDVAFDDAQPFHVYGAVQDESSARGEVRLMSNRTVVSVPFERAPGGEVTSYVVDAGDGQVVYASESTNGGSFGRYDLHAGVAPQARRASIMPGAVIENQPLRGAWMAPLIASPHDGRTLYVGFQSLYRSTDHGATWKRLSDDLSSGISGLRRPDFVNEAISTIAESPKRPGLIYLGTDDGRLHVTTDGGGTWTDLTSHLPHRTFVWKVVASVFDERTFYLLLRGRDDDDFSPYLFKSTDEGQTFSSLSSTIPGGPVNVLREDPSDPRCLYVGTDFGVYVSSNRGATWQVLGGNFPAVPVTDLQIHPRDQVIVVSTFGRGMWVLDALKVRGTR